MEESPGSNFTAKTTIPKHDTDERSEDVNDKPMMEDMTKREMKIPVQSLEDGAVATSSWNTFQLS